MPYVRVHVDLDVEDALGCLSDADLLSEVKKRGRANPLDEQDQSIAEEVERLLMMGDAGEALLFMQRWLRPKYKSADECLVSFAEARAA